MIFLHTFEIVIYLISINEFDIVFCRCDDQNIKKSIKIKTQLIVNFSMLISFFQSLFTNSQKIIFLFFLNINSRFVF